MVFWLFWGPGVVKSIGGVVLDVDGSVGKWFAIVAVDSTEEVGIRSTRFILSDDGPPIFLDGYAGSVERTKNGRECGVV